MGLFKKISSFLLVPIVLWVILFFHYQQNIKYDHYRIWQEDKAFLDTKSDEVELIVAGHSRPYRAIDNSFEKMVRIGTPGESYIETYFRLKHILENTDKNPSLVILPAEKTTFKTNDFRRSFFWKKYMNFLEVGVTKKETSAYAAEWLKATVFPFKTYYQQQVESFLEPKNASGGGPIFDKLTGDFSKWPEAIKTFEIANDIQHIEKNGLVDKTLEVYLQRTLNLLEQHEVVPVYIQCPLSGDYLEELENLAHYKLAKHDNMLRIIEEHPYAILIDFEAVFSESDSYFSDHHHLNKKGAEVFSKMLKDSLSDRIGYPDF
ncbi:MAG: hypothetical protein AAF502_15695 [Bacteroidota bacterium]